MGHVLCWGVYPSASSHFTALSRLLGSGLIETGKGWEWWNVQQIIIYGGDALKLLQLFSQHLGEYTLFIPRVFKLGIECCKKNSLKHFVVWVQVESWFGTIGTRKTRLNWRLSLRFSFVRLGAQTGFKYLSCQNHTEKEKLKFAVHPNKSHPPAYVSRILFKLSD